MFLEIDHISFTGTIKENYLKLLGYEEKFSEKKIPNASIKRNLLTEFTTHHDISLYKKDKCYGIEFTNHHVSRKSKPYIIPVFENFPKKLIVKKTGNQINGIGVEVITEVFEFPIYLHDINTEKKFLFKEVILKTNKLNESREFFKNFGFKEHFISDSFITIKFFSILSNTEYKINLLQTDNKTKHLLNDTGFSCIAILSNSAILEKKLLSQKGIKSTQITTVYLNNFTLKVFFVRGPSNELLEIISISK